MQTRSPGWFFPDRFAPVLPPPKGKLFIIISIIGASAQKRKRADVL